jgi:hypothetical protein
LSLCNEELLDFCVKAPQSLGASDTYDQNLLFAHLQRVTANHRLFVTTDGLMGIFNENVLPGDQVWVLAGGSHAFILREENSSQRYHVLVGEAYVDGVMLSGDIKKSYASYRARRQWKMGHLNAVSGERYLQAEP